MRVNRVLASLMFLLCLCWAAVVSAEPHQGCWSFRPDMPDITMPQDVRSVVIDQYFRVYYPASDSMFSNTDADGMPEVLKKQIPVFEQSRHFMETELGWKLPASRREPGRAEIDVYFIKAGRRFGGMVRNDSSVSIVMNRRALRSSEFPALWIHQFTHAVELQYRTSGDYWFFEATAGWMEGQFQGYSNTTQKAQQSRLEHPELSLFDVNPVNALGASRFLEFVGRPNRDVIRQTWYQWSFAADLRADEVLASVLGLNHLPDLESYLQNYFLLATTSVSIDTDSMEVNLAPLSAVVFDGFPTSGSGGAHISFTAEGETTYATSLVFFTQGEKSGTLAMKKGQTGASSMLIPYGGMDHYRLVVVNANATWLKGALKLEYDAAIPGVLEYFRVNNEEGGVQIEWKTTKEEGVAFWNVYRLEGGRKELLNDFPIPAAVRSDEGVHYMWFDSSDASFYSLEAITSEGFASPLATAESPQ